MIWRPQETDAKLNSTNLGFASFQEDLNAIDADNRSKDSRFKILRFKLCHEMTIVKT